METTKVLIDPNKGTRTEHLQPVIDYIISTEPKTS